jgi:hypothetical protein
MTMKYLPMLTNRGCNFRTPRSIIPKDDIEYSEPYAKFYSSLGSKHAHDIGQHYPKAKLSMRSLIFAGFPRSWVAPHGTYTFWNRRLLVTETVGLLQ